MMGWLVPAISMDCIFKFVVFTILLIKFATGKNKTIFFWSLGWLFFCLHALFELFIIWTGNDFWWFARHLVYGLTAAALLQSVIYMKSGTIIERYNIPLVLAILSIASAFVGVYIIGVNVFEKWFWGAFFVSIINGIGFIATAIYFWRYGAQRTNPAAYALSIGLLLNGLHNLDYPFLRPVEWFAPYGFSLGIVFSILVATGSIMLTFPRWLIEPVTEVTKPVVNEKVKEKYELKTHQSYLVREEKPEKAFKIFVNEVARGVHGLIVTRQYPDEIRERYKLEKTPIVWLSTKPGDDSLEPTNIGILTHTIIRFIEKSENSIILLDAVEFLIANNNFQIILKVIERLNEVVVQYNSRLIISLDPRTLETSELALLERNMEVIAIS